MEALTYRTISDWLQECGIDLLDIVDGRVYAGDPHFGPYGSESIGRVIEALRTSELYGDVHSKFQVIHNLTNWI
jgi:hypothetical protein